MATHEEITEKSQQNRFRDTQTNNFFAHAVRSNLDLWSGTQNKTKTNSKYTEMLIENFRRWNFGDNYKFFITTTFCHHKQCQNSPVHYELIE